MAAKRYKPFHKNRNMNIKTLFLFISTFALFQSCQSQCPEGINLLPMYGKKEKCQEQLDSDKEFLTEIDKMFKSREEAAKSYSSKGWDYFYKKDFETAMKRFNQAWLLNDKNYEIYWGFANIRGSQNQFEEAKDLFDLAKKLNPTNANFFISSASANTSLYNQNKNLDLFKTMISDYQKAVQIDPKNAQIYAKLAAAFLYLKDKEKATDYLKQAEELDPSVINPKLKKAIIEQ
jgi:tetratricopeptide (TPR) repeat protein